MRKLILWSNIGFLLGLAGLILATIPFFNANNPSMYNTILPILLGVIGLMLILKIKKEINDDIVKAGFVATSLAIILGATQVVIYFARS